MISPKKGSHILAELAVNHVYHTAMIVTQETNKWAIGVNMSESNIKILHPYISDTQKASGCE